MPGRGELTAAAWTVSAPLLAGNGTRGTHWKDHRTVSNGIRWKLRTGAPGRALPARYGPGNRVDDRLVRWRGEGTCDRLRAHVQTKADAVGEGEVRIDSTSSRAHQQAAGARQRPARADDQRGRGRQAARRAGAAGAG